MAINKVYAHPWNLADCSTHRAGNCIHHCTPRWSVSKHYKINRFLKFNQDDHPDFIMPNGDVRMIANIAGLVVGPHPSGDPKLSRCIQIVDGDLGGWLPASVVSMVTTQVNFSD